MTGCSVQVGPEAFEAVDAAARLVGNEDKAAFLAELEGLLRLAGRAGRHDRRRRCRRCPGSRRSPPRRSTASRDDRASVERTRAFVKVQDGCSFFCTYCIIPRARGAERQPRARTSCSRTCAGRSPPAIARSS